MTHIVQQRVVDGFANVAHRPLHVAGSDDLVSAGGVLIRGQDANLSTCHLLLMDIHCLCEDRTGVGGVSTCTHLNQSPLTTSYPSFSLGHVGACPSGHWVRQKQKRLKKNVVFTQLVPVLTGCSHCGSLALISAPLAYTLGAV